MKKLLKILLGIIVVIVLGVAAVFYFTADMVTAADGFFQAVRDREMDKAYGYLSEDFKASTSQAELETYLEKNQFTYFKDASWGSRSISGGRGELVGSITTESGGVVPITLSLVEGENGWKIYSITKPSSGIKQESSASPVPSESEQVELVRESMSVFAASVKERSMAGLHGHISGLWRQQISVEELDAAFGSFYELGGYLAVLDNLAPVFDAEPVLNDSNVLTISGHYVAEPNRVNFEHSYIYEGLGWKLVGLSVNIK